MLMIVGSGSSAGGGHERLRVQAVRQGGHRGPAEAVGPSNGAFNNNGAFYSNGTFNSNGASNSDDAYIMRRAALCVGSECLCVSPRVCLVKRLRVVLCAVHYLYDIVNHFDGMSRSVNRSRSA
jgi:hypothetical protein